MTNELMKYLRGHLVSGEWTPDKAMTLAAEEIERLRSGIQKHVNACGQCEGRGQAMSGGELIDCDECTDLRALLSGDEPTVECEHQPESTLICRKCGAVDI